MRLAIAAMLLFSAQLVTADAQTKNDAEELKGNWTAKSLKQGGKAAPEDLIAKFQTRFDGKNYKNVADGQVVEEGTYTIDSSKTPKTIDFDIKSGESQGKKQLAIFQVEGDKLTLVVAEPGSAVRPKALNPDKTDPFIELVLERTKP
jgi:uncharacterized protein (TIGR03067 family)